jgi:hypothetical protein
MSTLTVSPDAAVYAVVPRRRPRAGEPHHAFPGRLPCASEVAAVGQAWRATAARCATVCCAGRLSWAVPWAAHAAPTKAEMGHAPRGRGPCALCTWAEPTS